jgi:cytidylate kinase
MILAGTPGVVHIGIQAPLDVRIETMMRREHFSREEAKSYVEELEQARVAFFRKFFKVHPYETSLYHMVLNTGEMGVETAAKVIVHAVEDLAP